MAAVLPHPVDAETVLTDPVEVPDVSICTAESLQLRTDLVAPEEPLQIRLAGCDLSVTMRSPGDDFDLVIGFLLSEGIIDDSSQIASIRFCPDADGALSQNIVNVNLASSGHVQGIEPRPFRANSSCGVCGRTTIDDLLAQTSPLATGPLVSFQTLASLPALLSERQPLFHATGGIHAAGLFSHIGRLLVVREDIGRQNRAGSRLRDASGEWTGFLRGGAEGAPCRDCCGCGRLRAVQPGGRAGSIRRDDAGRFLARGTMQHLRRSGAGCVRLE